MAELVKQVRDGLAAQIIVNNSSNVGELTDSLNHSQILFEKNSQTSNRSTGRKPIAHMASSSNR